MIYVAIAGDVDGCEGSGFRGDGGVNDAGRGGGHVEKIASDLAVVIDAEGGGSGAGFVGNLQIDLGRRDVEQRGGPAVDGGGNSGEGCGEREIGGENLCRIAAKA